tara:strand:- start:527 stop:1396 length:870 start_codon:yes stop_codon:yes gene_type:complete
MAVPSSGEITLVGIFSEKNESDYDAMFAEENNISLAGLSRDNIDDSDGGEININQSSTSKPNDSPPFAMTEFYGYDHDAVGTTFSSVYSAFTILGVTNVATTVSTVRTFSVVNGSGALTINIGSIAPNTGTLAVAASSTGDPGNNGTGNNGTGFVNEGTTLTHTPTLWSQSGTTIYLRFKYFVHTSATSTDVRTVTHTVNSSSNTVNVSVRTNAAKSDMRLKTNIDRIGYSDMNIPIYLFNYKDDLNTTYKGVMAQDLLELGFNSGVILDSDGYYSVDYNSIDVDMERV